MTSTDARAIGCRIQQTRKLKIMAESLSVGGDVDLSQGRSAKQSDSIDVVEDQPGWLARMKSVLGALVHRPAQVASIAPSSSSLTKCIADRDCVRHAKVIVDLGPGAGGTTRRLLKEARNPECQFLAVELSEQFIPMLHGIGDPRLTVEHGDAANLAQLLASNGLGRADVIVSGLPFSSIDDDIASRMMSTLHHSLNPAGTLIAYQFRSSIAKYAAARFWLSRVDRVWWNIPPLQVYEWRVHCRKSRSQPLGSGYGLEPCSEEK